MGRKDASLREAVKSTELGDDYVPAKKREESFEKLSWIVKIAYGLPQFSMLSLTLVISIFGTPYYERMGAGLSYIAFFQAFARSFDIMTDPLMGWISDNTRMAFGRRRPYMLAGMFGFPIMFILLMMPPRDYVGNTTAIWFGFFYVAFYIFDTIANVPYTALGPELTSDSRQRETVFFVGKIYAGMGTLLGATAPEIFRRMLGGGTDLDTIKQSYFLMAVCFGGMYTLAMLTVVGTVKERRASCTTPPMPLVPSVLRTFKNRAFRPLLIGWVFDAIALSTLAAMFPFFIQYVIKPDPNSFFNTDTVIALCFGSLFSAALIAMPIWYKLSLKFGKYNVWMAFNLLNFCTNAMYAVVGEGDPKTVIALTFFNGLPLGGSFLVDAILADTIDYDEFLNGTRNEGGFTVFSTFIPKFVSVPAGALPLTMMAMIGFKASLPDGTPQDQDVAVVNFIRFMFVVVPCLCALCAAVAKTYYPIKTEEMVEDLNKAIELHHNNFPARDPISGEMVTLLDLNEKEQVEAWVLDNFSHKDLRGLATRGSNTRIVSKMTFFFAVGSLFTLGMLIVTVIFFNKLDDPVLSCVPILSITFCGSGLCFCVVTYLRLKAAKGLNASKVNRELLEKIIEHKEKGQRGGSPVGNAADKYSNEIKRMVEEIEMLEATIDRMGGSRAPSSSVANLAEVEEEDPFKDDKDDIPLTSATPAPGATPAATPAATATTPVQPVSPASSQAASEGMSSVPSTHAAEATLSPGTSAPVS